MAHILVVDEDVGTRIVVRTLLEHAGHTVVEAAEGRAGLAAIEARLPDLVITELYMDGMDGIEFLRAIRKRWPDQPVLITSSRSGPNAAGVLEVAKILGASGLLDKPIDEAPLMEAVGAVVV